MKTIIRAERQIIKHNKAIDHQCFLAKNLYNYTNYLIKKAFEDKTPIPKEYDLSKSFAKENQVDYRALPSQVSQQVMKMVYRNWKSFFRAIKDFAKNPSKYKASPRPPKFLHKEKGRFILTIPNQSSHIKDGMLNFTKSFIDPIKTKVLKDEYQQTRIIPRNKYFVIEIIYKHDIEINNDIKEDNYLSIDLGVNNFCAITTNNPELPPLLINGGIIKSINQFYNKKKALLMSYVGNRGRSNRLDRLELKRANKVSDFMHKTSKYIIDYCLENKIGNIVIGYNPGWKQKTNMGKVNNQNFVNIPYYKFVQMLEYKADTQGIKLEKVNESYTSLCDAMAYETIEKHEEYLGNRPSRGIFQSSLKKLINSDVNESINILRNVINDSFVKGITDRGLTFRPVRVNPLTKQS